MGESDPRPDFAGFLAALVDERRWIGELHSKDKTGGAASDQRALADLEAHVERVGKRLGFLGAEARCGVCRGVRHEGECSLADLHGDEMTEEAKALFHKKALKLARRIAKLCRGEAWSNKAGPAVWGDVYAKGQKLFVCMTPETAHLGILFRRSVGGERAERSVNEWWPWELLRDEAKLLDECRKVIASPGLPGSPPPR